MTKITRRQFLSSTMGSFMVPSLLSSQLFLEDKGEDLLKKICEEKSLSFYNIHTGESLKKSVFWSEGGFIQDGLASISKLFRDHRTGDVYPIDPTLLELLHALQGKLETDKPFHLISGFRSLKTNAHLHEKSSGVAKQSQHCLGKAADIALPGVRSLKDMGKAAKSLKRGGVGVYSQFIHVDTGRVRSW